MTSKAILAAIRATERMSLEGSTDDALVLDAAVAVMRRRLEAAAERAPKRKRTPAESESTPPCGKCGGRTIMQDGYLCGMMGEEPRNVCVAGCDDQSGAHDA
jgi:hypothetical protein